MLQGVESLGFVEATPVQEKSIPVIMEGRDLIASAQTGTGKTAAFLLPVIQDILKSKAEGKIKALVIVPTRELALQIDQQLEGLAYFTSVSSLAIYGGTDGTVFSKEKKALISGADVVLGTPGRLLAHLNMGYANLKNIRFLILDEADRMLDMGFYDDILRIFTHLPEQRQNLMFSATMPEKIRQLAKKVLKNPAEIRIAIAKPVDKVLQVAYVLYEEQKLRLLIKLLNTEKLSSVIVFCSTKIKARLLYSELKKAKLSVAQIHSDLEQTEREKVMRRFSNRELKILVATDIISRGIDVENIDLIINYDVPRDPEDYIHRIGRTARAEAEGIAITFISEKEQQIFLTIEDLLEKPVQKVKLPPDLGAAPEYRPHPKKSEYKRKQFRQKGKKK